MGAVKRRRQLAGSETKTPVIDPATGEVKGFVRWAGYTYSEYFDKLFKLVNNRTITKDVDVPCNGCVACCYHKKVDLHPDDTGEHLDAVVEPDGSRVLRKREDGACIHLGATGCTVYEHRPRVCRQYDCRVFALVGVSDTYDGGRHSPGWMFEMATAKDRILSLAMNMGALPVISQKAGFVSAKALEAASNGMSDNIPKATKIVAWFDSMSVEQQRAIVEATNDEIKRSMEEVRRNNAPSP
jgi:hypothetical protein